MTGSKISVHIEPIVKEGGSQIAAAWIEGVADKPYRLWFRVDTDRAIDERAQAHAFAVAAINQAMAVGKELFIDGPLTRGLIMNLEQYQRVWTTWQPRRFRYVALHARTTVDDEPFHAERGAILPFSGGLDSMYSASALVAEGRLAALVMIHGLDLSLANAQGWATAAKATTMIARSLGVPAIFAATNWQEVAPGLPGYLGYLPPTIAVPVLMSQHFGYAVMPSGYSYHRLALSHETTPISDPMLGRPGFPVIYHGAWMRRIEKVRAIAAWPEGLQHLRPCDVNAALSDGRACGHCRKCIYTTLLFCGLGLPVPAALGGKEPTKELIESFPISPYGLINLEEAVEAAKSRAATDEWVAVAERRLDAYAHDPAVVAQLGETERRLAYVLGSGPKTAFGRYLRRLTRALRGRDTPRDLPPLLFWPITETSGPASVERGATSAGETDKDAVRKRMFWSSIAMSRHGPSGR